MEDCLFCKIINKTIPAKIVFENEDALCFQDITPQAPHHYLIIPKKHYHSLNAVPEEDAPLIGKLYLLAKTIAEEKNLATQGYRLVLNCNQDGGQTVFHLHIHLLAGRQLTWPPG